MEWKSVREYHAQFLYTLSSYPKAVRFTHTNKLWEGFWRYGWVSRLLVVLAVVAGLKFLSLIFNWFQQVDTSDPLVMASSLGSFFTDVAAEEFEFLLSGGMKYIMLILLEIVIFHMCRRTFQILSGKNSDSSLKAFIRAQIRMLKVALRCYILETVIVAIINTSTGIFGFLEPMAFIAVILVQAYFVGFTVIDNYYEQFGLTIKESTAQSRQFLGVTLAAGLTLQLLFLIPILGTLVAPVLAAVAVTIVLYEITDFHHIPPVPAPVVESELV
jgi:hypothetical protein